MDAVHSQLFLPASLTELFSTWARVPDSRIFAGGTEAAFDSASKLIRLPGNLISLEKIQELHKITRTERYLEIGAMVRLNDLLRLGKIVPAVLRNTIEHTANTPLRNSATIGGNICYAKQKLNTHAPLSALDATYELRTASSSRWISASRFDIQDDPTSNLDTQEMLTRIRIPLDNWDYTIFKKFEGGFAEKDVIVFIAKAQKNIIIDARLVFAGLSVIRNKSFEAILVGEQLPLSRKAADGFITVWDTYLFEQPYPNGLLAAKITNFIRTTIEDLTK